MSSTSAAGIGRPSSAGSEQQRGREVAAGRATADHDAFGRAQLEQGAVHGDAVVERGRVGVVGRHAVVDRPDVHPARVAAIVAMSRHASPPPAIERAAVDVEQDGGT